MARLHRMSLPTLALFTSLAALAQNPLGQLGGLTHLGGNSSLSDTKIASGLKQALSVGTKNAVHLVDKPGGYLDNPAIKILLPKSLQTVESLLRGAGQGPKIDSFVGSMNHAAESAAPAAEQIFADAVTAMTIDDARKLLNGGDTSITEYFKSKTSTQLATAFRPSVERAMSENDVTKQYQALTANVPQMPFMKSSSLDINTYVVNQALNGLFYMLGQQEKDIRQNPAARTTGLLKEVFGR
jgi:Protein of unknown function (DUF4197)